MHFMNPALWAGFTPFRLFFLSLQKSADFEGVRETDAARGFAALAYGLLVLFSPVFRPSSLVPRGVGVAQGCARRRVSEANRPKGGS